MVTQVKFFRHGVITKLESEMNEFMGAMDCRYDIKKVFFRYDSISTSLGYYSAMIVYNMPLIDYEEKKNGR